MAEPVLRLIIKSQTITTSGNYLRCVVVTTDPTTSKDITLFDKVLQFNIADDRNTILEKIKLTLKQNIIKQKTQAADLTADLNKEILVDSLPG